MAWVCFLCFFCGFQKQRVGIFLAVLSYGLGVFRGSKSNWWLKFRSGLGHDFIVFRGSKRNVSRFLRLHSCNGLDAKPAGALPFRMRSRRSFLRLCLVADVSQWLRHVMGHDFIVFRGSKSNVSRFLRLHSCNGLDAKPAGLLPFRMRSRRSFLGLAWWLQFRSGWGTISLFLGVPKATFRDFWGCSSAMAWTQNLLGLCLFGCAPDAAFLGFAWWLKFCSGWGTISLFLGVPNATFFGCAPDAAFLGFAWWLQFRSGWGTISLFLGVPKATFLPFRMRSRRSFLRLCLVAEVSQWLGHAFHRF